MFLIITSERFHFFHLLMVLKINLPIYCLHGIL